ncbi:LysR family transcriptional regulator, partial [Achromobacter ruhlandii]
MVERQFNARTAVVAEPNITAAAQRRHRGQPALSGTIKSLEGLLGAQLFERQARGVAVTDEARILYPQARRLVAQTESMARQFRQDARLAELRIGVEGEIAGAHLRAFVARARQAVPNLLLHLLEGCVGDAPPATDDPPRAHALIAPPLADPHALPPPVDADHPPPPPCARCPHPPAPPPPL